MANLPTMQESNVTTKKSSLDKILPLMAKDIGVIKTNFVKLIQQHKQTNQRSKSESFFAKALQKENMYESRSGRGSSSPSKVGSDKKGMLFDPKVGVFDFIKGFLNNILKGMLVGGGLAGLSLLFDSPGFRKLLTELFSNIFTILVKGLTGAASFLSGLTKDEKFKNAIVEAFVAISQLFIDSLSMMKDVFTDDRVIKSIKSVAANLIKTIGDILKTEVDLGKVGPLNIGKHSLGSILTTVIASLAAFRVALIIGAGRLLALGAGGFGGPGGKGAKVSGGGGFGNMAKVMLAVLAGYFGSKFAGEMTGAALDDWAQKQIDSDAALNDDDDALMKNIQQSSGENSSSPGETSGQKSNGINPSTVVAGGAAALTLKYGVNATTGGYKFAKKNLRKARAMNRPTPAPKPVSPSVVGKPLTSFGEAGAKREMVKNTTKMQKFTNFINRISNSEILRKKFYKAVTKKCGEAVVKKLLLIGFGLLTGVGAIISIIGAIFTAYDLYQVYELAMELYDEYMHPDAEANALKEEQKSSTSPVPAAAVAAVTASTSPTQNSSSSSPYNYETYKNLVAQKESGGKGYGADNKVGFLGKYQFGAKALETFGEMKAGSSKQGDMAVYDDNNWKTPGGYKAFLNDPARQESIMSKYTQSHIQQLKSAGVITSNMNGGQISGALYAAHHGGVGGAIKLYKHGEDTHDKYLANSSVMRSAAWMNQQYGQGLQLATRLKPSTSTEMASGQSPSSGDLLRRNTQSVEEQKTLALTSLMAGGSTNIIGNVINNNDGKSQTSSAAPPVSAPWNEEMFFRNVMNDMLS